MKTLLILTSFVLSLNVGAIESSKLFFENFKQLCGKSIVGKSVFPTNKNNGFYGKELIMTVKSCSEKEIRVPFSVGSDDSRTWILSINDKGLLLKHDHRHKDGTPDKLTMYGGYADQVGNAFSQSFPADERTKELVPKGVTNVWTLTIDQKNKQFVYYLERHNKPRFKAVFELID